MFESQWDIFVPQFWSFFYTFLLDAHASSTGNRTSLFVCACTISFHYCFCMLVKTLEYYLYSQRRILWCCRYAIGNAERPMLHSKVGWLDILANDTHQFYGVNNTGGPSIKVHPPPHESVALKLNWTIYFGEYSPGMWHCVAWHCVW